MNTELYVKKLEEQNEVLRKQLKWKLEFEENMNLYRMVISNFVQLNPDHVERIVKQIQDYPFNPHPISDKVKKKTEEIIKTISKKMNGDYLETIKELSRKYGVKN